MSIREKSFSSSKQMFNKKQQNINLIVECWILNTTEHCIRLGLHIFSFLYPFKRIGCLIIGVGVIMLISTNYNRPGKVGWWQSYSEIGHDLTVT